MTSPTTHAPNNSSHNSNSNPITTSTGVNGLRNPPSAIELSENFFISSANKNNSNNNNNNNSNNNNSSSNNSNSSKSKQTVRIEVILNSEGVYLRRETNVTDQINEQLLRLEDIVGSHCGKRLRKKARGGLISCRTATAAIDEEEDGSNNINKNTKNNNKNQGSSNKDISAYLYIFVYLKEEKPLRRSRTVRILRFRTHNTYEENLRIAERWHAGIRYNKSRQIITMATAKTITTTNATTMAENRKQLLILLNPKSGKGKGRELFQNQVAPVLKEAEIPYELLVTAHSNHARELMCKSRELLQRYAGVVVASGDGLFYEILNGVMERPDWREISLQLPLGIIPCGSGNGLAKSIAQSCGEPYDPKPVLCGTLACLSGHAAPMDIIRVEMSGGGGGGDNTTMTTPKIVYSFLAVGWGLIADIDIESERLRSIGSPRFTVWSVHRVISLRTYRGKLSYLPYRKEYSQTSSLRNHNSQSQANVNQQKRATMEFKDAHDGDADGDGEIDDEFMDILSIGQSSDRSKADSWHSAASKRTAYYSMDNQSMIGSQRASMASRIEAANAALEARALHSTLPPLGSPLPTDLWHCEEGEYVMVHAANTTHLASDCHFAPDSKLDDGIIYLIIIRSGISRSHVAQFLLSLSSGTHLPPQPHKYVELVPVKAFRIEPADDKEGILTVDGEKVNYGPIQCEIFSGLINVMVPHPNVNK